MKSAFIGHRRVFAQDIEARLTEAIQAEINNGCVEFTMGTHGAFDKLALSSCKKLRKTNNNLEIEVVITRLHTIEQRNAFDVHPYDDVKTVMFDIENAYYKQQLALSNRQMIDDCNTLICYVNTSANKCNAKAALRYAENNGLKIVNLFHNEDAPFLWKYRRRHATPFSKFFKINWFLMIPLPRLACSRIIYFAAQYFARYFAKNCLLIARIVKIAYNQCVGHRTCVLLSF